MGLTYDRRPKVEISGAPAQRGWPAVAASIAAGLGENPVLVADGYPGADFDEITRELLAVAPGAAVLDMRDMLRPASELEPLLAPWLTDDRVFGRLSPLGIADILDSHAIERARVEVERHRAEKTPLLIVGTGAALVTRGDLLVFADMPRWEIQLRLRAGGRGWTADDRQADMLIKYKRGYFIDWRIADRHKLELFASVDIFLDTTLAGDPRAVEGDRMRKALAHTATRPFRVVPYFDPGVWGGHWMRDAFELPPDKPNYAWGFDCVPEENSLLLDFAGVEMEVPSLNLVLRHPEALLGPRVYRRFGAEFPIRFDLLDTMGGGNLSLQVHPTAGYARQTFGLPYTQDESYYILAAGPDAHVYLGVRDDLDPAALFEALATAQAGGPAFAAEQFVNRFPARQHDHFSIPAGTIHCAGAGCVVLEISATPYIFTFKLWDWGRLGLDGRPRPIHLEHGRAVLDLTHDASWARREILDQTEILAQTGDTIEERTGLHRSEFIETRRHWFTGPLQHTTNGSVNVLNLVAGDRAVVTSPDGAFPPFEVGYAETFIVPAAVDRYTITPLGTHATYGTICASVRE